MSRDLFIVGRDETELYAYLTRHFAGRPEVMVVLDRRSGDRRRRAGRQRPDRRHRERRRNRRAAADLRSLGFAVVIVE